MMRRTIEIINTQDFPCADRLPLDSACSCSHFAARAEDPLDKLIYPLAKASSAPQPKFELDVSEVADDAKARDWAEHAQALCEAWFPIICRLLATDDWKPPETIRLVMKKELAAPGVTSGATIEVSAKWINDHPDDFGLVIHELTHVIQAYPPGTQPGWLVEGVADYIRYWRFEPEKPHGPIGAKSSYRDGYGTTAAFLAWLVDKYDHRIIRRLDAAPAPRTVQRCDLPRRDRQGPRRAVEGVCAGGHRPEGIEFKGFEIRGSSSGKAADTRFAPASFRPGLYALPLSTLSGRPDAKLGVCSARGHNSPP